ncbi:hypothetical protein [Pedosphaera parvula]|uniref:Uncharacterized protein n=1 Tax=Pedosphaera parvula (strain Ellin514) TaxID=320771 RepID=B9XLH4_PEDPL|nr:hypothetical protein [Pedosphaera parvula]EEF59377.1 hypothetical protein Cflav_PD1925 [Pedosphaera parvula Ellin514]
MICQTCGIEAKTRHVEFHQNIGALVIRFNKSLKGNLCKSCIHKYFWQFTLINLTVGWLGIISLIVAPIYTINNLVRYLLCLKLEPVPAIAKRPELTQQAINALQPFSQNIVQRLNAREGYENIAKEIAPRCGVTPGQVILYIRALIMASRK